MHGPVGRVGVADFAAACACDGHRGEEAGAVFLETRSAFHETVARIFSQRVETCNELVVDCCVALLGLLALRCYALDDWTFAFPLRKGIVVEVALLRAKVRWNGDWAEGIS